MALQLIICLMALCTLALTQRCPTTDDKMLGLDDGDTSRTFRGEPVQLRSPVEVHRILTSTLGRDDGCKEPTEPDDLKLSQLTSPAFQELLVKPAPVKTCEPCPPKSHTLTSFFWGKCHVIFPNQQLVRFVTCEKKCRAPCMCSKSVCQRTRYSRIWFFSVCWGTNLPFGYVNGLNFRYLHLPQDCKCRSF